MTEGGNERAETVALQEGWTPGRMASWAEVLENLPPSHLVAYPYRGTVKTAWMPEGVEHAGIAAASPAEGQ